MIQSIHILLPSQKKVYFASDFHLGGCKKDSDQRERRIIRWMEKIKIDAAYLFLVGDIFDFWFEYRTVIPKGFLRFQAKMMNLIEMGIKIIIFTGNHDMWMSDYFTKQINIDIFRKPQVFHFNEKKIFVAHGDGLGPGDFRYKILKKIFTNSLCNWLFSAIHPSIGMKIATTWAAYSWKKHLRRPHIYSHKKEYLWQFAKKIQTSQHHDYYVFGHRHIPLNLPVDEKSRYINLGEWIEKSTYAVFDGNILSLKTFRS